MPSLLRAALAALLAVSMLTTTAGAWSVDLEDDKYADIEFIQQDVWFESDLPVGNLATLSGAPITWSTTEASGDQPSMNVMNNYSTFTDGTGVDRDWNTFTVEGTFTGHLDTIAVDLYSDARGTANLCPLDNLAFEIEIDGRPFLMQDQASPSAGLSTYTDGDYTVTQFIFTRLFERAEDFDMIGDADTEHTIRINMANFYACNENVVYYGAETTPSRMSFNLDPDSRDARFYSVVDVFNPPGPLAS